MPNGLDYVKRLLKLADKVDGEKDNVINKAKSKAFADTLIARAESIHCPAEAERLRLAKIVIDTMKEENFSGPDVPLVPNFMIDKALKAALKKTDAGSKLLAMEHIEDCPKMDYSLPGAAKSSGHNR